MELAQIEHTIKKVPTPVLLLGAGGVVLLAWWFNRGSGSSSTPSPIAALTDAIAPNTTTPSGICPPYQLATCGAGTVAILETDSNGCPISVCSSPGSGGGGGAPTPQCHSTLHGGTYTVGHSGPLTTPQQIYSHVGQDINCFYNFNPSAQRHNICLTCDLWPGFVVFY